MNAISEHTVPVQVLEPEAFQPYGQIIRPRVGTANQFSFNPHDPEAATDEARLVLCNGQPRLWIMKLPMRGLRFTQLGRHRRVTQCLGALQGKEWFMAFAPPGEDMSDDARPRLEDIAVFRIPGDCVVKMHVATWHAGPHFTHEECLFFNLENLDTNHRDFHAVDLPMPCRMVV
jgi:ureidoglycolate hydrolase